MAGTSSHPPLFSPPPHPHPHEPLPSDQTNYITILGILHRRVHSSNRDFPFPIHEADVNKEHPADLTLRYPPMVGRGGRREWYFFSKLELTGRAKRTKRINKSGAWQDKGTCQTITNARGTNIGCRNHFTHYDADGKKTGWIMKEFRLQGANEDNLVLCKVYANNRQGAARAAADEAQADVEPELTQRLAEVTLTASRLREEAVDAREKAVDARETAMEYREMVAAEDRDAAVLANQAKVEFMRRLAAREAEFEHKLAARETEFDRKLAAREAEFERKWAAREASVTAREAAAAGSAIPVAGNPSSSPAGWPHPDPYPSSPLFSPGYYPAFYSTPMCYQAYVEHTPSHSNQTETCILM